MPTINPVLVNDVLTGTLFPQAFVGESFLLKRDGLSLEVNSSVHGKLSGSGSLYLTNMRLVFHCSKKHSQPTFMAYQVDLCEICDPKFEQPIFGANYLKGNTNPRSLGYVGDTFRMYFNKGGAGVFLHVLHEVLTRTSVNPSAPPPVYTVNPKDVAFMDPSDPSVVYVQQPIPSPSAPPLAE